MALNKAARSLFMVCGLHLVLLSVSYAALTVPTQRNYWLAFEEFEAGLPMRPTLKSFESYTCPPWVVSETLVKDRAEFMSLACSDYLVAIYKEREYGAGRMVYHVALSPSEHSLVLFVYEFRPSLREIDNGFFYPRSYKVL